MILKRGHHSVIEHANTTVRFICNRGVSHEIVRHRIASYSQESTRYCDYSKFKHGSEIACIDPRPYVKDGRDFVEWVEDMESAERRYFRRIERGYKPQIARGVLPIDLKTELVMTANLREWRHFFSLRAAEPAHPQMRKLGSDLLFRLREDIPVIFDGVGSTEWARDGLE
jgi:thymidylate synthase (FAD)